MRDNKEAGFIMKDDIVLIGGGGHCRACIDVIELEGKYKVAGIVDVKGKKGKSVLGYEIFACDDDLPELVKVYGSFLVTIGQIKSEAGRAGVFESLKGLGASFPVIVSPLAYVSKYAAIAEGTIVMHKAFVNAAAKIGRNCIINTGAIIEHDAVIGDNCHIATGSVVNGGVLVGGGTLAGSNSVINNNLSMAGKTILGSGAVVVKSIEDSGTYAGNPARRLG